MVNVPLNDPPAKILPRRVDGIYIRGKDDDALRNVDTGAHGLQAYKPGLKRAEPERGAGFDGLTLTR